MINQAPSFICHAGPGTAYPKDGQFREWASGIDHLRVFGLVKSELNWRLDDFSFHVDSFSGDNYLFCNNPRRQPLKDQMWVGMFAAKLADLATPLPQAQYVVASGRDGHQVIFRMNDFIASTNIIAMAIGYEYLTPEQGGPFRLIVPHLVGQYSVKALQTLEFTDTI